MKVITRKNNFSVRSLKFAGLVTLLILLSDCASTSLKIVNHIAKDQGYLLKEDIVYGPHKLNKLDLYLPTTEPSKPKTVVVFFYGGCWGACQTFLKKSYRFVGQALASRGYITVIANYRAYPEVRFHKLIQDAAKSVSWVTNNIAQYNGNPRSIFLMGHSAGAHIAATLSYDKRYLGQTNISGFIGLAGAYDFFPFDQAYQGKIFAPPSRYPDSQPINFISGNEPPSLLLYGTRDRTVKPHNITNLSKKIRRTGGIVETHLYKRMGHVRIISSLARPFQRSRPVLNDIDRFIRRYSRIKVTKTKQ